MIYLNAPTLKKPVRSDSSEDEEEAHARMISRAYKMGKWKYSLFNKDNVHQIEVEEKSVSPMKGVTSPKGSAVRGKTTPTNDRSPYEKRAGSISVKTTKRGQK